MKFFTILIGLLMFASGAFALATRDLDNKKHPFVGIGTFNNQPHCTYTIVEHGLLITAKHCFTHGTPLRPKSLHFYFVNKIEIPEATEVILDDGDNDIAWIRYDKSFTQGKIDLPPIRLADVRPATNVQMEMPGSAVYAGPRKLMNVSVCTLTGKEGYFPPKPADAGYEGLLLEFDCPAWYGQSGSPVLSGDAMGGYIVEGVLSHTFNVHEDGSLDMSKIKVDQFGEYSQVNMFSPLYLRSNFK